jgi:phosphoribosylaminoimidazole-succinocarboxamide synthase
MLNRREKPALVPAEVVVTDKIRPISSLHKDLRSGKKKPGQYGLYRVPDEMETVFLDEPVVRESTKLDKIDVYQDNLLRDIGLTDEKRAELRALAIRAFGVCKKDTEDAGLELVDGKFEFIWGPEGEFYIGDTFLTSDENRFLAQSRSGEWIDISKQLVRDLHTITGYRDILEAAQEGDVPFNEWPVPDPLDDHAMRAVEESYAVVHQQLCRKPMDLVLEDVATRADVALKRQMERYGRDILGRPINITEV